DGVTGFGQSGSNGYDADRPAPEIARDHPEIATVNAVETESIDHKPDEGGVGGLAINDHRTCNRAKVADAAQKTTGNSWRAPGAAGNFHCTVLAHRQAKQARTTTDDLLELFNGIKLKPRRDAEAIAQRVRQKAKTGRRGDQGKPREV